MTFRRRLLGLTLLVAVLAAAVLIATWGLQSGNFSQYPGFAAYFGANPPSSGLPTAAEQALLERHRPRFYLAERQSGPIDFYADYIAHGVLRSGDGGTHPEAVTQQLLNAHKRDPDAVFSHDPRAGAGRATVYGRVDHDAATFDTDQGPVTEQFTFLTYNLAFSPAGLPAAIPRWREALFGLVASLDDWRQLDHHGSVTVVLDRTAVPVAAIFQQHGHLRTHLLGAGIEPGPEGRIAVDIAIRSHQPYPHEPGPQRWRAVPRPDSQGFRYLLTGEGQPWYAADDLTNGTVEVDYVLRFLPQDDAFYMFQGHLGEKRRLPGRSGPPGAAYNVVPALKLKTTQLFAGYWREDNVGDIERFEANRDLRSFANAQAPVFYCNWQALRRPTPQCP